MFCQCPFITYTSPLVFNGVLPGEIRLTSPTPLVFCTPLVPENYFLRTFGDNWHMLLHFGCHPTNSVETLKVKY